MDIRNARTIEYDGKSVAEITIDGRTAWHKSEVPDWGIEVKYVQSDKESYCVTPYEFGDSLIFRMELSVSPWMQDEGILGICDEEPVQSFGKGFQGLLWMSNRQFESNLFLSQYEKNTILVAIHNPFEGVRTLNGKPFYTGVSQSQHPIFEKRRIFLFKTSESSAISDTKIYHLQMWDRELNTKHEFIPCLLTRDLTIDEYSVTTIPSHARKGCYGFYDKTTDKFYGNASERGKLKGQ